MRLAIVLCGLMIPRAIWVMAEIFQERWEQSSRR
jgi:hypothetical protein